MAVLKNPCVPNERTSVPTRSFVRKTSLYNYNWQNNRHATKRASLHPDFFLQRFEGVPVLAEREAINDSRVRLSRAVRYGFTRVARYYVTWRDVNGNSARRWWRRRRRQRNSPESLFSLLGGFR
ncbi:hypothetical protein PUN28_000675 [Cardiocondyla obscurior]|uniref:Uncharacterized protein n=1 Tax=Cardiocondyla obscurior TaxID=286306 RepID=A0AAW2H0I1_9HYME